jgi:hypothetical protein
MNGVRGTDICSKPAAASQQRPRFKAVDGFSDRCHVRRLPKICEQPFNHYPGRAANRAQGMDRRLA